jgi:hypothetical protein
MRGAVRIITEHRDKLDKLAHALLRNEVLERGDIDRIMEGVPRMERSGGQQGLRVVAAAAPGPQEDPRNARTSAPPPGV